MLTRKCDICGKEMRMTTPRYKVIFDGWLYTEEVDICMDCFKRIAEEIEQTDLLVKTPHKSRESHEGNCETCRDKDAYDEWEGNCDECENGSMYTPQTYKDKVVCPNCGRSDYIRSFEKDFNIKNSGYRYKCINCNTYIKDTPQTEVYDYKGNGKGERSE